MVHDDIPWIAITGMRNRLVHAYFVIDATSMELQLFCR